MNLSSMNTIPAVPVRILIVDDDPICRELLRDAISQEGVSISLAGDGIEGLQKLAEEQVDILITDLNMPRMDGLSLFKEAKYQYPQIVTIIITGYGNLESAIEAIRQGTYDFIQKPFKIEEILVPVRNAVEKVRMMKELNRVIEELKAAYEKLQQMEREKEQNTAGNAANTSGLPHIKGKDYLVFSLHNLLPLRFLENNPEQPVQTLRILERLRDLRKQGIIDDEELMSLKRKILAKDKVPFQTGVI